MERGGTRGGGCVVAHLERIGLRPLLERVVGHGRLGESCVGRARPGVHHRTAEGRFSFSLSDGTANEYNAICMAVSLRSRIKSSDGLEIPDFLPAPFEKFWKMDLTTLRDRPLPRARAHDGGRDHARRGTRGESGPKKPARPAFPHADSLIAPVPKPPQPPPISFFSRRRRGTPRPLQRRERRQSASRAGEPNRRERFRRLSSTPSTVERGGRAFFE